MIKNIIFDLGGIFIDIHFYKTKQAFEQAGVQNFDEFFHQSFSNPLFSQLETAAVSPEAFYEGFRNLTKLSMSNQAIQQCWNAMLGNFRLSSLAILPQLKNRYNIYLLSNTNQIHYDAFINSYEKETGLRNFNNLFHQAYYSHAINERKPNASSFLYVLNNNNLAAAETLFVDDTYKNIEGAQAVGLQTLWLQQGLMVENEINKYL
jgi:glucose-1-phosphatase